MISIPPPPVNTSSPPGVERTESSCIGQQPQDIAATARGTLEEQQVQSPADVARQQAEKMSLLRPALEPPAHGRLSEAFHTAEDAVGRALHVGRLSEEEARLGGAQIR